MRKQIIILVFLCLIATLYSESIFDKLIADNNYTIIDAKEDFNSLSFNEQKELRNKAWENKELLQDSFFNSKLKVSIDYSLSDLTVNDIVEIKFNFELNLENVNETDKFAIMDYKTSKIHNKLRSYASERKKIREIGFDSYFKQNSLKNLKILDAGKSLFLNKANPTGSLTIKIQIKDILYNIDNVQEDKRFLLRDYLSLTHFNKITPLENTNIYDGKEEHLLFDISLDKTSTSPEPFNDKKLFYKISETLDKTFSRPEYSPECHLLVNSITTITLRRENPYIDDFTIGSINIPNVHILSAGWRPGNSYYDIVVSTGSTVATGQLTYQVHFTNGETLQALPLDIITHEEYLLKGSMKIETGNGEISAVGFVEDESSSSLFELDEEGSFEIQLDYNEKLRYRIKKYDVTCRHIADDGDESEYFDFVITPQMFYALGFFINDDGSFSTNFTFCDNNDDINFDSTNNNWTLGQSDVFVGNLALEQYLRAKEFVESNTSDTNINSDDLIIQTDSDNSNYGTCYFHSNVVSISTSDARNTGIMLHEIGHHLHDKIIDYGEPLPSSPTEDGHNLLYSTYPELAYVEGFATFFSSAVREAIPALSESFQDYPSEFFMIENFNLENQELNNSPSIVKFNDCEAAIASFLWDIYDDSTMYETGEDDDFCKGNYCYTFSQIWKNMKPYQNSYITKMTEFLQQLDIKNQDFEKHIATVELMVKFTIYDKIIRDDPSTPNIETFTLQNFDSFSRIYVNGAELYITDNSQLHFFPFEAIKADSSATISLGHNLRFYRDIEVERDSTPTIKLNESDMLNYITPTNLDNSFENIKINTSSGRIELNSFMISDCNFKSVNTRFKLEDCHFNANPDKFCDIFFMRNYYNTSYENSLKKCVFSNFRDRNLKINHDAGGITNLHINNCKFINSDLFSSMTNAFVDSTDFIGNIEDNVKILFDTCKEFTIKNSFFKGANLLLQKGDYNVEKNEFIDSDQALSLHYSSASLSNNIFYNCGTGIFSTKNTGYTITGTEQTLKALTNNYLLSDMGSFPATKYCKFEGIPSTRNYYIKIIDPPVENSEEDIIDYNVKDNFFEESPETYLSPSYMFVFNESKSTSADYNLYQQALSFLTNNDLENAKNYFKTIISNNTTDYLIRISLKYIYHIECRTTRNFNNLLTYYCNLLELDSNTSYLFDIEYFINECHYNLKNYSNCIIYYSNLLETCTNPEDIDYYMLCLNNLYLKLSIEERNKTNLRYAFHPLSENIYYKQYSDYVDSYILNKESSDEIDSVNSFPLVLSQNYPNPFNPSTTISFSLPARGKINVSIFNIKGQKIKVLTNKTFDKGRHVVKWNGLDKNNQTVASGIYFYQLKLNEKIVKTNRCILLK